MHVSGCGIPSVRQSASCDIKGWVLGFWGFRSRFESVGLLRFSGGLGLRVSGCSLNNREIVFPQINIIVPPPPHDPEQPSCPLLQTITGIIAFCCSFVHFAWTCLIFCLLCRGYSRISVWTYLYLSTCFACCVVVIAEYTPRQHCVMVTVQSTPRHHSHHQNPILQFNFRQLVCPYSLLV